MSAAQSAQADAVLPDGTIPARNGGYLRPWKPGQSGNPGGRNGEYGEMMRLCRDQSVNAAYTLVGLMNSEDDRVAMMAAKEVMERAWGKPKEAEPEGADPASLERRAQLIAAVVQLLSGTAKPESK